MFEFVLLSGRRTRNVYTGLCENFDVQGNTFEVGYFDSNVQFSLSFGCILLIYQMNEMSCV